MVSPYPHSDLALYPKHKCSHHHTPRPSNIHTHMSAGTSASPLTPSQHERVRLCMHTHTHIHVHTHVYTHIRASPNKPFLHRKRSDGPEMASSLSHSGHSSHISHVSQTQTIPNTLLEILSPVV